MSIRTTAEPARGRLQISDCSPVAKAELSCCQAQSSITTAPRCDVLLRQLAFVHSKQRLSGQHGTAVEVMVEAVQRSAVLANTQVVQVAQVMLRIQQTYEADTFPV